MALFYFIIIAAALFAYRRLRVWQADQQFRAFAKEKGCQDPYNTTKTWPQTIKRLWLFFNMHKLDLDLIDDIIVPERGTIAGKGLTGTPIVSTAQPENIQAILATQFDDFVTGEMRYRAVEPVLGRSIFSSDGAFWKHSRDLMRPQFSRANVNDLEATEGAARALIQAIETSKESDSNWTADVDMLPLFYNLTLDTSTEFLFGESVGSQSAAIRNIASSHKQASSSLPSELATSQDFAKDFETLGRMVQRRMQFDLLCRFIDSRSFRRAIVNTRKLVDYYAQKAIDENIHREKQGGKDYLMSALASQTQDRTELRNQTMALLFAGRDTTAALLSWCIARLAVHPDTFADLREAILNDFRDSGDETITSAKLKSCRPLQHFINEVLRLNPIVPFNARVATRTTTLPVGGGPDQKSPIAIRKGQIVGYSVYIMHRRKDLWGDDALEFKPSRWEQRLKHSWQFLPFNGGPRICLGQQFALVETSYVLVRLLLQYEAIQPVDPDNMAKMRKALGLATSPRDGVKVRWLRNRS